MERPAGSSSALDRETAALAERGGTADTEDPEPMRLLALPVRDAGGRLPPW